MTELEKLVQTWEKHKPSGTPHEHIWNGFIDDAKAAIEREKQALNIADVSNSSFNDEKFIEALFAEYNKSYKETKQGQHYPQWLNDEQLKWVLTVARNCC